MDNSNSSSNTIPSIPLINDFNLDHFIDQDLNFNHVINMLRGSNHDHDHDQNFDPTSLLYTRNDVSDNYSMNFLPIPTHENHVFNNFNSPTMSCTNNNTNILNSISGFEDETLRGDRDEDQDEDEDDDEDYMDGEHSSATTTTTTRKGNEKCTKKGKMDRSRTLISERKRRGRMKEKLYALRALVPNITKMDKASIVGDAVLYVQDLQMQAKKLKSQIEGLESSLNAAEICQGPFSDSTNNSLNQFIPACKIIVQMDVVQIEEREFYVKVVSNKGQGVAASLYKALDSFTTFTIQNSNLSTLYEQFVFTFTLNVAKCREDFNLPNMKMWISGAFLNQGFEFQSF